MSWQASSGPSPGACRRRQAERKKPVIASQGGASEPPDMLPPGRAGGAVAVRRTLATTICRVADPTQVPRPRQLRDASTVMRFRPAHQSMINRRHDDRASCRARHSLKQPLEKKPRIHTPATGKGGHESGQILTDDTRTQLSSCPRKRAPRADRHCICGPGLPLPRERRKKRRWEPSVWFIPLVRFHLSPDTSHLSFPLRNTWRVSSRRCKAAFVRLRL